MSGHIHTHLYKYYMQAVRTRGRIISYYILSGYSITVCDPYFENDGESRVGYIKKLFRLAPAEVIRKVELEEEETCAGIAPEVTGDVSSLGLRAVECRECHTAEPCHLDCRTANGGERLRHHLLLYWVGGLHSRMCVELDAWLSARDAQAELLEALWHKLDSATSVKACTNDKVVRVHVAQ